MDDDHFQLPSVSIVVAVYNGGSAFRDCLESCVCQDYQYKKIIVVDGGSSDQTTDLIADYSNKISYSVSERDNGVYHAWNKALKVIDTDWVTFLGADDVWATSSSLSEMMKNASYPLYNFVFAQVYRMPEGERAGAVFGAPWDYSSMKWRMTVGHTGMLHHASLFRDYGCFNDEYRIAGDYEFLLRVGANVKASYVPEVVVLMGAGGMSNTDLSVVSRETRKALKETIPYGLFWGWVFGARFGFRSLRLRLVSLARIFSLRRTPSC